MKVAPWALTVSLAAAGPTSPSFWKREVTWGNANGAPVASSAVCSKDQMAVITKTMPEVAALAQAGSDALGHIADYLSDDAAANARYNTIDVNDRLRMQQTYGVLFGKPTAKTKAQWSAYIPQITAVLDRIKGLTADSWPSSIRIYCDSSYDQDKDPSGKTWDQVDGIKDSPPGQGRVYKYDYDLGEWASRELMAACTPPAGTQAPAGFTLAQPDQSKDRIVFCPDWFTLAAAAGPAFSDMTDADITTGYKMTSFARKTARLFFHEHLHTWTFNQGANRANYLDDVEGGNSYSWTNAVRLANGGPKTSGTTTAANVPAANRNIENVVYWCIAMYWDKWFWQDGTAQSIANV